MVHDCNSKRLRQSESVLATLEFDTAEQDPVETQNEAVASEVRAAQPLRVGASGDRTICLKRSPPPPAAKSAAAPDKYEGRPPLQRRRDPNVVVDPLPEPPSSSTRGPSGSLTPPLWRRRVQQLRRESGKPMGESMRVRCLRWLTTSVQRRIWSGGGNGTMVNRSVRMKSATTRSVRCKRSRTNGW